MPGARVVVVDHHDSYTWNLVHLVAAVTGTLPAVVEHDEVTLDDLADFSHVVLSPGPGNPMDTGDFAYVRLHGDKELYTSGYTEEALHEWAERCRAWEADGLDVFVYFDNDVKGYAPHDALRLIALVG